MPAELPKQLHKTQEYLKRTKKDLKIIVEARNLTEVQEILSNEWGVIEFS